MTPRKRTPEVDDAIQAGFEGDENVSALAARFGLNKNHVVGMARRRAAREFLRLPPAHRDTGATLFTRLDAIHAAFDAVRK